MPKLRQYQRQALHALSDARRATPDEQRQIIMMATGLGKTITFAAEADRHLAARRPGRPVALVHTDELADQALRKIQIMAPGRSVGLVKAGSNDLDADITVASVPTLADPARRRALKDVGLVIVDECHHATAGTYQSILGDWGALDGRIPATGYTATPERSDGSSLYPTWQGVAFSRSISWAVRRGYLVQPVGYRVTIPGVTYQASDGAMDAALVDSIAPEATVREWQRVASDRSTVLFAPLVESARAFAAAFERAGVRAGVVHGAMDKRERRALLAAYDRGDIQVICNAMVLTEGWDSPRTSCVILGRMTKSRPLGIQMCGRGLRPWLDGPVPREQQDCLLLFLGDGSADLFSQADLSDREGMEERDGVGLTALEDEFDLSKDLEPDPVNAYAGTVELVEFDPLVAQSSKVWTKTAAGVLFVPSGRGGYVFLAPDNDGMAVFDVRAGKARRVHRNLPDTELAMVLAEDLAVDRGGDMGRLLADKDRAWRKAVPSAEMRAEAARVGLAAEVDRIMAQKASGKAGRVSDLISKVKASRVIDPVVERVKKSVVPQA